MKIKTPVFFTTVFCAVVAAGLTVVIVRQQSAIKRLSQTPPATERMRAENMLLKEGFFHTYDFEGTAIDCSSYVINPNNEAVRLHDLLSGRNWLAVFITVGACRDCIYNDIEFIKGLTKENINVVVGIDGLTVRDFTSFVRQYELEKVAYLLPDGFFPKFEINPVVYFMIDRHLNSKYFYAPSMVFPDLTKEYYKVIKNRLNS